MKHTESSPTPDEVSVTHEPWEGNPGIDVYVFDGPEASGKIGVERGAYGLHVYVPGHEQPVALIDLFHLGGTKGCAQIVIHDTVRDDAVAFAKFPRDRHRGRVRARCRDCARGCPAVPESFRL